MFEIQQQLPVFRRQMEQLASRSTDSEGQRAEEAANAAAIQEVQKVEEDRQKGRKAQECNAHMPSLFAVQKVILEGRSRTTAAGSTADEKQQQGKAAGDSLQKRPGRPEYRQKPTRSALLDRLDQRSNAYRAKDPFGGGESYIPVGFGSAEDQFYPDDDVRKSHLRELQGVK